jgi:hypothetical protein
VLFLMTNFVLFGLGIYLNLKARIHRLNNTILSCHIFLFHVGFIGMFAFYSSHNDLYHHFSTFGLFFFFTGAIHEILTAII